MVSANELIRALRKATNSIATSEVLIHLDQERIALDADRCEVAASRVEAAAEAMIVAANSVGTKLDEIGPKLDQAIALLKQFLAKPPIEVIGKPTAESFVEHKTPISGGEVMVDMIAHAVRLPPKPADTDLTKVQLELQRVLPDGSSETAVIDIPSPFNVTRVRHTLSPPSTDPSDVELVDDRVDGLKGSDAVATAVYSDDETPANETRVAGDPYTLKDVAGPAVEGKPSAEGFVEHQA